ncbi:DUF1653-like domain protein [Vibrio phage 1.031.O._10N.261.46.F8]|nr:DUF1653-like domain protein [Vibrio phage 1.031.O._10N.261.46.F8]
MAVFNMHKPFEDNVEREFKLVTSIDKLRRLREFITDEQWDADVTDTVESLLVQTQTMCNTIVQGVWEHSKKGTQYLVTKVGRDADDLTMKVYYTDLTTGQAWDRPCHEWLEYVQVYDAQVPRFQLIHAHTVQSSIK